jgi:carbamoyl-phosphate synthase small subunit
MFGGKRLIVKVFPLASSFAEIMSWNPAGVMISNGPGDPSVMTQTISLTKELVNSGLPCFGICLGHQIIALSQGLKTKKMFNGHRGINHPVKNLISGKSEITSQNHGFVVTSESLDESMIVELTHIHLNDNTVAGVRLKEKPVFSVQYHPEASAGPHDSRYLFDDFIEMIKKHKTIKV